ncbi:MAG: hypothetical protein KatS3mg105_3766 [Gemmatales bacterium]|nr:MAG: hypothetical protein KatS3mg105_3766 [Gemmatales bacterium]
MDELRNIIRKLKEDRLELVLQQEVDTTRIQQRTMLGMIATGLLSCLAFVAAIVPVNRNIVMRMLAEEELLKAKETLEARVQQRTTELRTAVEQLRNVLAERENALKSLQKKRGTFFASLSRESRNMRSLCSMQMERSSRGTERQQK